MSGANVPLAMLRGRVEREERELEAAVRALVTAARQSIAPAHWIRERPWVCMTGALVVGFWWGSGHGRRERNRWR